jgi:AcrR family transcriptional regulator
MNTRKRTADGQTPQDATDSEEKAAAGSLARDGRSDSRRGGSHSVQNGYNALTTNIVAEKAGVGIGSVYQYFPNKESLLGELMRRHTLV